MDMKRLVKSEQNFLRSVRRPCRVLSYRRYSDTACMGAVLLCRSKRSACLCHSCCDYTAGNLRQIMIL